jgi:hypothetical protein
MVRLVGQASTSAAVSSAARPLAAGTKATRSSQARSTNFQQFAGEFLGTRFGCGYAALWGRTARAAADVHAGLEQGEIVHGARAGRGGPALKRRSAEAKKR